MHRHSSSSLACWTGKAPNLWEFKKMFPARCLLRNFNQNNKSKQCKTQRHCIWLSNHPILHVYFSTTWILLHRCKYQHLPIPSNLKPVLMNRRIFLHKYINPLLEPPLQDSVPLHIFADILHTTFTEEINTNVSLEEIMRKEERCRN